MHVVRINREERAKEMQKIQQACRGITDANGDPSAYLLLHLLLKD